jgi:hypothetical protein
MNLGRGRNTAVLVVLSAALLAGAAGCGDEAKKDVVEGEPLDLGDLQFNVQLTRFLNPNDPEDSEYLKGQQVPPPSGKSYLAVFMEVKNTGDADARLPALSDFSIVDTTGAAFSPVESSSDFALDLGGPIPAHEEAPAPGSAAANGPAKGSIVLFLVDEDVGENRPLDLEIDYQGQDGTIELDI